MDRPTCGTCPHRVLYRGSYGCARETPSGVIVGDTVLAAAPYVPADYPGCQHHPHMGRWLATREEPAVPESADDSELEQWRKALVWCKSSVDSSWSSLIIVRTGATLSYVVPTDGDWLVGRGGQRYPSRDAAMRAAEAALGLPKCRVEGEP